MKNPLWFILEYYTRRVVTPKTHYGSGLSLPTKDLKDYYYIDSCYPKWKSNIIYLLARYNVRFKE